jgi:transposase
MGNVITIGVDLAKSVFQVHGVDAEGMIVVRRQLRRRQVLPFFEKLPPCLVGMEACATSHHWARELEAKRRTIETVQMEERIARLEQQQGTNR